MNYEINVSLNGRHYFATAERSIINLDDAREMLLHFKELFPADAGYKLSLKRVETRYELIDEVSV